MIVMMTVATAAIGLLPTWSTIGILAPILLLLLRLAQGFSAGGEVSSSVAFVIESAPDGRRGWYGGWHMASIAVGLAAGFGVAALFAAVLHDDALTGWGWRVAFLTAAPLGLIARYIRRRLDETQAFESVLAPTMPRLVGDVLRGRGTRISRGFVLVAALGLTFNIWFVFLPSHLAASGAVPLRQALGFAVVGLFAAAGAAPVMGRLSDHFGRRPVLIASTSAIAASTVPGFMLASHSVPGRLVSFVGMGVLVGTLTVTAFVAEIFPTPVRATGVALTYGIATAVFGGTAPVMATLFTTIGATWLVPGFVTVMALIALAAAVTAEETAFDGLG
jgi:MHS family proline/betaine transporter-like MFS transporter